MRNWPYQIITGLNDGGAESVLYRLCAQAAEPLRHSVVSLSPAGKYSALLAEMGVTVHHLSMPRGRLTLSGIVKLFRLLRREKPEHVQTWMYHANLVGGLVARLAGVPGVFWSIHHTDLVPGATGRSTRIVDWLCARISHFVPSGIVACAHEAQRVHVAKGYDAAKFVVIPNGYDVSWFSPDAASGLAIRQELGIAPDAVVMGLVGRWNAEKDHANLVAAFARVLSASPGAHLLLVGTDCTPENPALAALLAEAGLGDGVHLLGRRDDIRAVMNALDLHVLSSRSEAFPNVVAEAMACGTPCVVTDVGDAALIVGESGWVVPPKNPDALADAIGAALREKTRAPGEWAARQRAARQRILDNFSLAAMVAAYEKLWKSA